MIAAGGPNPMFSKSAMRRLNNNQAQAARMSMPHNQAAQQAVRNEYSGAKAGGPPVGQAQAASPSGLMPQVPTQQAAAPIPTGGPQMAPPEQFDPSVFVENQLDQFINKVKLNNLMESPRVKDSMTKLKLRNFFNQSNPKFHPDPRSAEEQVAEDMGAI